MSSTDFLLKIDGIAGESLQNQHEGWIELEDWSWGCQNEGSSSVGSGAGAGKVRMDDFSFGVKYGISSPKLFLACATGLHIPKATLHIRKAGGDQQIFIEWKFTDILISRYRTSGRGGSNPLPTDRISFNFSTIEIEYKPQRPDGTLGAGIRSGYNVKKGQKV